MIGVGIAWVAILSLPCAWTITKTGADGDR